MSDDDNGFCLGGEGCNCVGGKMGDTCVLTVFIPLLIVGLIVAGCLVVYYSQQANQQRHVGMPPTVQMSTPYVVLPNEPTVPVPQQKASVPQGRAQEATPAERIKSLKDMVNDGLITDAEFERRKTEILDQV